MVVTGEEPLVLGGAVGLYIDMAPDDAVAVGDWIATDAGSRYLVEQARRVKRRQHSQQVRYQLRCRRLPKHADTTGQHVIWLAWYPRGRRR